ncbi:hypothetical protein CAP36_11560 [Chitinophagaceae bacterium IBVUCB2]|nr:hypothetical protein CAP36_11560 [Chitinophagaceae bacterium IBVUCB2]
MKSIVAPFLDIVSASSDISDISLQLDKLPKHLVDCFPWPVYKNETAVNFSIAASDSHVLLKFRVKEKNIRAINTTINSPVYEDSCVEFFIAFDDAGYYNFEFNCIGTRLAEYGKNRKHRRFLPPSAIEKIVTTTVIKHVEEDFYLWHLTIMMPFGTFKHHDLTNIRNQGCRANFYKCGDKLPSPHYIVWSPVFTAEPDFHQPKYFGELIFGTDASFTR